MDEPVTLLKRGKEVVYHRCDLCGHYARELSRGRQWCGACEYECTEIGKRVRAKLNAFLSVTHRERDIMQPDESPAPQEPRATGHAGSTGPASRETPRDTAPAVEATQPSGLDQQDSCG